MFQTTSQLEYDIRFIANYYDIIEWYIFFPVQNQELSCCLRQTFVTQFYIWPKKHLDFPQQNWEDWTFGENTEERWWFKNWTGDKIMDMLQPNLMEPQTRSAVYPFIVP